MKRKLRLIALGAAIISLAAFAGSTQASAVDADQARALAVVQPSPNTVGTNELKNNGITSADYGLKSIWGGHIHDNTIPWLAMGSDLRGQITSAINTSKTASSKADAAKAAADAAAAKAQQAKDAVDALPQSPSYLANWGEIFRNTEGNARAQLGTSSSGEGLNLSIPSGTDKIDFGNEADFAGKPVVLNAVGFKVFQTGENSAIAAGNMPSIKFEINPDAFSKTYTTLVYTPDNSASNVWTSIDAKADTGAHWGFTGVANDHCGLNGPRCTLAQALAELGPDAKFYSASVGKGKDHAWHGAIASFTVNGDTFTFHAGGVTK